MRRRKAYWEDFTCPVLTNHTMLAVDESPWDKGRYIVYCQHRRNNGDLAGHGIIVTDDLEHLRHYLDAYAGCTVTYRMDQ